MGCALLVLFLNNVSAVERRCARQTKQYLMKTFKITIMQQLKMLAHMLLIYPVIFVGIYFSVDDFSNFLNSRTLYIITLIFFIIDILPTLIIHIQYLIANHHSILEIDTSQKVLIYISPKKNVIYPFQEIKSLIYFNNYGNNTGFYSFAEYKFFRIIFNDGNFINVTCLMMKNIKNELPQLLNIQSERNTQFLALINSKVFS